MYDEIIESIKNIDGKTDYTLASYCAYYEKFKSNTFDIKKELEKQNLADGRILTEYNKLRMKIMEIYRNVLKGNIQSASTQVRNLMYGRNGILTKYKRKVEKGILLYKYREYKDENKYITIAEDFSNQLFHLPYNMRQLAKNCRYSISGLPCLYLGDSVETCIRELRKETDQNLVGARYTLQNDVEVYSLRINWNTQIKDEAEMIAFLKKYLLIHACSYRIQQESDDAVYIPFYTIPQMITAAIASKDDATRCIEYSSTRNEGGINYVFIPKYSCNDRGNYDEELRSLFSMELIPRNTANNTANQ